MSGRLRILHTGFDPLTLEQAANELVRMARSGQRCWVSTINVAIFVRMRDDKFLRRFSAEAKLAVADGQALVWASRLLRRPLPERVAGIDLVSELCKRAAASGLSVYFLGGSPGVANEAAARLQAQFPKLTIAGAADGFFDEKSGAERARAIRQTGADLLFVGMGVPRQEQFIKRYWDVLGVRTAIPVGGSFDVLSGRLARAPRLLQRSGLEWTFRLAQEPRRLFWRYFSTNSRFIMIAARALVSRH